MLIREDYGNGFVLTGDKTFIEEIERELIRQLNRQLLKEQFSNIKSDIDISKPIYKKEKMEQFIKNPDIVFEKVINKINKKKK